MTESLIKSTGEFHFISTLIEEWVNDLREKVLTFNFSATLLERSVSSGRMKSDAGKSEVCKKRHSKRGREGRTGLGSGGSCDKFWALARQGEGVRCVYCLLWSKRVKEVAGLMCSSSSRAQRHSLFRMLLANQKCHFHSHFFRLINPRWLSLLRPVFVLAIPY